MANIHSTLARKTSNESFLDDQLQPEGRSKSMTSIVRTAASEEGSVRGRTRRTSANSSSRQPSRLWVEKGSFWTSLELTDQSTTLGNSSQHRIHQLKVRRLLSHLWEGSSPVNTSRPRLLRACCVRESCEGWKRGWWVLVEGGDGVV